LIGLAAQFALPFPELTQALHVRCEHVPGADATALAAKIAERFRSTRGVTARVELVERGKLPRFAYKAARVIDEE